MATHSSVLAWRIPGTGEPGGLPSMGSRRVRHNWSNLAAAVAAGYTKVCLVKAMVFPVVMHECESWTIKKAEHWRTDWFEKTLMLGKTEGRQRERQRMRWLMASLTWWTWIWASSGSWWWTGKPGVLRSMGSQRVRHYRATELNWYVLHLLYPFICWWTLRLLSYFVSYK